MEQIPYKIRLQSSKTPCPHGMMATCTACKMNKPHLVHVGSGLERGCPFLVADDTNKHIVTCNFMPDFFPGLVYDSN